MNCRTFAGKLVFFFSIGFLTFAFDAPSAEYDQFGIEKIYADAPSPANRWVFSGNPHDPRFFEQSIVPAGDGWFYSLNASKMRLEVLSDPSANEQTIQTFDLAKVLARGFLYKSPSSPDGHGDFLNIEQTWRFRVRKAGEGTRNEGPHIELVPGAYRHTASKLHAGFDQAVPQSCEAMSYHFNVYPLTGRVKFEKESDHTSGYTVDSSDPQREHALAPFADGREMVEKAVLY